MEIYKAFVSANETSMLLPAKEYALIQEQIDFDGSNKIKNWSKLEYYVSNPKKERTNFFALYSGSAFACDTKAVDSLMKNYEGWIELLPINLEDGTELFIVNITEVINAIDQRRTIFDYYNDGTKGRILQYAFHEERLGESPLFKIPETASSQVLTYSIHGSQDEFYTAYKQSGLGGLKFELLYTDGSVGNVSK